AYCVTPSPSAAISPLSLHDALPIYQLGALLELHPVDVGASGEVRVLGEQVHGIHLELGGEVVQRGVAQVAGLLMIRSAPGASAAGIDRNRHVVLALIGNGGEHVRQDRAAA